MNEIQLSTDLKQIELEITYHKQIAGQYIWEIGKRLNHVKENDLVHGEFMSWYQMMGLDSTFVKKAMKVANEFSNSATLPNLGETALYIIATLPDDQKQEQLAKAEQGDPSTVRELQELKKQLKTKDNQINNLSDVITEMNNREPEVKEKIVPKIPADYTSLKVQNGILIEQNSRLEERYTELLAQRQAVDEKSAKYEQLTQAINQAEGQLSDKQKVISNYKQLSDLLEQSNEFLSKASSLVYQDLSEVIGRDGLAKRELGFLIERVEKFVTDLKKVSQNTILEGEIINE